MLNIYEQSLVKTVNELRDILGRTCVLDSFINQSKKLIDENNMIGEDLISASLTFRNVTLKGNVPNLYLTESYSLGRYNLSDEVDMILSRECLFQVSQSYEILETFLYDMVSEFILKESKVNIFLNGNSIASSFDSIRKELKNLKERKNNRHLINIIRSNCIVYALHEQDNIYNLNLGNWLDMFSEVRHCVTHSRMTITREQLNRMPQCFDDYFAIKTYGGSEVIYITPYNCKEMLSRTADFVFLIYKALTETSSGINVNFASIEPLIRGVYSEP